MPYFGLEIAQIAYFLYYVFQSAVFAAHLRLRSSRKPIRVIIRLQSELAICGQLLIPPFLTRAYPLVHYTSIQNKFQPPFSVFGQFCLFLSIDKPLSNRKFHDFRAVGGWRTSGAPGVSCNREITPEWRGVLVQMMKYTRRIFQPH